MSSPTTHYRDADISEQAKQLIAQNLVWDNHSCMPLRGHDTQFLPQLNRFRQAGVNVVSLNVGFDSVPWDNTLLVLANFRSWIARREDEYMLVKTVDDIETVQREDRLGITFDIEGACALNGQLSMIELYYDLGVRWMLMAYNRNNEAGGGCQDEDPGLTDYGRDVLDEMKRTGMVVCCSHTGLRTTMDIMEYVDQPVIFSHSNPAALRQHRRNIPDEAIRACAATGGVVGINGIGIFLGENEASVDNVVRHIDHAVQLVGPDHVGIGLDYVFDRQEVDDFVHENPQIFPPGDGYADGLEMLAPEAFPQIVHALLGLGYQEEDIRKIMGGNHLRIAGRVWK